MAGTCSLYTFKLLLNRYIPSGATHTHACTYRERERESPNADVMLYIRETNRYNDVCFLEGKMLKHSFQRLQAAAGKMSLPAHMCTYTHINTRA